MTARPTFPRRYRVGTQGLTTHGFPSINRTKRFYEEALGSAFELVPLGTDDSGDGLDAIVNFGGSRWWRERPRPSCPILFAIHGGAIVNPEIAQWVEHLTTADCFLINCPSDQAVLGKMFGSVHPRFGELDLPVPPSTFDPIPTAQARTMLGLDPARGLLGFVARLLPQKNAHVFLRLLAAVREQLPDQDVQGLMVGSYWLDYPLLNYVGDEYPDYLDGLSKSLGLGDAVMLLPASDDDMQLRAVYSALDIMVHPTNAIDENFGYAPVEAMACGTPVVGAAYGGLKSTVVDGTTGALVDTWATDTGIRLDFDRLVQQTVDLLADPERLRTTSAMATAYSHDRFGWPTCERQLVTLVHEAIECWNDGAKPVEVAAPPASPISPGANTSDSDVTGMLPANDGYPWEYFRTQIEEFVSRAVPRVDVLGSVRLAAPLRQEGSGLRLDDPTWPATFKLSPEITEMLEGATVSIPVATAIAAVGERQVNALLAAGVLTGSLL